MKKVRQKSHSAWRAPFATLISAFLVMAVLVAAPLRAAESDAELAKKTQNPVADLISVPFQNNFNFNYGPNNDVQYVLNVQPVIPFHLTKEWNLITRTIIPVINQPWPQARFGLGDANITLFLSPARLLPVAEGGLFWGVGPILQFPTATNDVLGSSNYAAGPNAVVGYLGKTWVLGALANNIWSYGSTSSYDRPYTNFMTVQPFINYNLPKAWYLSFSPIITANWQAKDSQQWTVPVGAAVGKIFRIGKLPFNANLGAYYNVARPDVIGPEYQIRAQIAILLPSF
jgi:hypothetical protein